MAEPAPMSNINQLAEYLGALRRRCGLSSDGTGVMFTANEVEPLISIAEAALAMPLRRTPTSAMWDRLLNARNLLRPMLWYDEPDTSLILKDDKTAGQTSKMSDISQVKSKREALLGGVLMMALTFLCIAAGVAPTSWARLLCSGLASTVLAAFIAHAWPSK